MFTTRDRTSLVAGELRNTRGLVFTVLENGSIFTVTHDGVLINQIPGTPLEGGLGNVYLRRLERDQASFAPVQGPASESTCLISESGISWEGSWRGLDYRCTLRLAPDDTIWFWSLDVTNTTSESMTVDAVLAQDLGLGEPAMVQSNELYASQYIDHAPYKTDAYGFVVCSRQNQQQGQAFPWILHGCLAGATGYLTDGFQFFGLDYKETNVPAALVAPEFPNVRYQYEIAMPALKSDHVHLSPGESIEVTFVAVYQANHPEASSEKDVEKIESAVHVLQTLQREGEGISSDRPVPGTSSLFTTAPVFPANSLTSADLDHYFGTERRHEEQQDGATLSFFHGPGYHVVTKEKELLAERPHGHILRSGQSLEPNESTLSVTAWMYGVFASHLAIGNTNLNKLLTISRNPLNVLKSSGQRIFVKTSEGYALLGLPSAFEMGLNSARWIYKGNDATIEVKLWTSMHDPACYVDIAVDGAHDLEFLISNNVVVGDAEFETGSLVRIDEEAKRAEISPAPEELLTQRYPEATFYIVPTDSDSVERVGGDELLLPDGLRRKNPYVVFRTRPVTRVRLALVGSVLSGRQAADLAERCTQRADEYEEVQRESGDFWKTVCKNATLQLEGGQEASQYVARLNDIVRWYAHNAMVHFTTPYGLEQYSGAAWGVRDVCQGPTEFLLATRNFDSLKHILRTVYAHQLEETGDWPQWFMFDRYWDIYAPDSHGDIVIWPMKAICDYVEATDDLQILDEEISFTDDRTRSVTEGKASLFAHTVKQIERMERACIAGTALIGYGHGDWEDTLQPADPAVRGRWVSPWTVELMYQTLVRYAGVCERAGRQEMSDRLTAFSTRIKQDFPRYLMKGGVVSGLAEFGRDGIDYLLHPEDSRTGVHYRLLPMTRGMISGMFSPDQMRDHLALIEKHLTFPDGVRLMDRPLRYHGGVERLFKRAETAANFGREIGLQYVHAHIRYVEAMAMIGRPEALFEGLLKILPICTQDTVPSAMVRQSNAYFSSSDAAFRDRYEAWEQFERIKSSEIGVKGGWRVYSSGPGMVVAQVIRSMLGLREYFSDILLDPVLPKQLDGLTFDYMYGEKRVRFAYMVKGEGFSPQQISVNGTVLEETRRAENPYRQGGLLIPKVTLAAALDRDDNVVEIQI